MAIKLRLAGYIGESITDGDGLRGVVFFQGCTLNCPGCQNPQTHAVDGGLETDTDDIISRLGKNPYIDGVTFSGGEPFLQAKAAAEIARAVKQRGQNVWSFTGHTYEELQKGIAEGGHEDWKEFLELIDVLVDGPFIEAQKSLELKFRGSKNQRILKLEKGRLAAQQD